MGWVGWVGGWEEKWRIRLSQLSTLVEVEVEAELGKKIDRIILGKVPKRQQNH